MRHTFTLLFFLCLSAFPFGKNSHLHAQQTEDAVVPITATVNATTPQVDLAWEMGGTASDLLLIRREKGSTDWFVLLDTSGTGPTTFTDTFVEKGMTYEYGVIRVVNGVNGFGYMTVPIEAPPEHSRGSILVFVEAALQIPLAAELDRLGRDLAGDGWLVTWLPVTASETVSSIKSQIVAEYNADPDNLKSVLLLGEIPVPYSGNTAWDGHPDHQGAWAADTYYGDIDGTWQDVSVNNTTPNRPANVNVPGDGKFDHSVAPSATELAVGRVDFSNLSEATFGTTRTELMRRYLDKNHRWRNKQYTAQAKALVDDNFGYFGGEAFAANGYRNFYPIVGVDSTMDGDFFGDSANEHFLLGYGCGGGSYTSANGVGNSTQFANSTVNIVFSMIFGSYHGDWDSENNPFMMSALASEGGLLSCSWAGRPHWFYHHLAAGETLGYCGLATQNACDNAGYLNTFGNCGTHVTLLGDPTLRAHIVAPATNLSATNRCFSVELDWAASLAPGLLGYHVYRASDIDSEFTRLTTTPLTAPNLTDTNPLEGENVYQVRALVLENTPSGSYFNMSTGVFVETYFEPGIPPTLSATGATLSCSEPNVTISATSNAVQATYAWSGPGNFSMNGQSVNVVSPGTYSVTVTDDLTYCSSTATALVTQDGDLPTADPMPSGELNCINSSVQLSANPGSDGLAFEWSNADGVFSMLENPTVTQAGNYSLMVTADNGCTATFFTHVLENTAAPNASIAPAPTLTCTLAQAVLDASASSSGPQFAIQWTTIDGCFIGDITLSPTVGCCGTYSLVLTNTNNGCTATASVQVPCDFELPEISVSDDVALPCYSDLATVTATTTTPGATIHWLGQPDPENPTQMVQAGIHEVTATAPNGCTTTDEVIVTSPPPLSAIIVTSSDCEGFLDLSVTPTGGVPPYMFAVTPTPPVPPNTPISVSISDANGCSVMFSDVTPGVPPAVSVSISHTDETIAGWNDGSATAQPMGGTPPFVFNWSNGGTGQTITGLAPGTYTVTVTDENSCTDVATVEVLMGIISGVGDVPGLQSLAVFPNPTGGHFDVNIVLEKTLPVSIELTDVAGRVFFQTQTEMTAGKTWQLDLSGQAPGVYFCNIKIDGQTLSRRVVRW